MNIKITADSTCDLSPELVERYNIEVLPLYVVKDGKNHRDGVDICADDVYAYVDQTGKTCSTAALNIEDYDQCFSRFAPEYDAIIHINISSDFSCCHQNACLAAEKFDNVYVVDSRNLSTGHGHVVIEAAELAKKGMKPEEICEQLKDFIPRVDASFILDRLDYMAKGGRCSAVVAFGANLLKLKVCIEVQNGKMFPTKKYRGAYKKCMVEYIKDRIADRDDLREDRIFITHSGMNPPELIDLAYETVKSMGKFRNIYITRAGCTVSNHCGENTIGVLYIKK